MKKSFRLKDTFTTFDHENVLMRVRFWYTSKPTDETPSASSFPDESCK